MSKEYWYGMALGFVGITLAVLQMMYPIVPYFVGWPIVFALGVAALICVGKGVRRGQCEKAESVTQEATNQIEQRAVALSGYSEEWGHFTKISDAITKLQYASLAQAKELSDIIQHERIYLDDSQLQSILDNLLLGVNEWAKLGVTPEGLSPLIPSVINNLTNRMHKRYRRS